MTRHSSRMTAMARTSLAGLSVAALMLLAACSPAESDSTADGSTSADATTAGTTTAAVPPGQVAIGAHAADGNFDLSARPDPGANGTAGPGPEAISPGVYDATIAGLGAPLVLEGDPTEFVPRRNPQDPLAVGAVDAPVVISEFSDLECPYCARFQTQTLPQIVQDYVDTGLVRIEWNDLTVNGPNARVGALALRAAAAQGYFTEYLDAVFATHTGTSHPNLGVAAHKVIAEQVGIPDLEAFAQALDSEQYGPAVDESMLVAETFGISGTPSFIIGAQLVVGAQPAEVFAQAIEIELAREADKRAQ